MTSALNHRYPAVQGEGELESEFENEDELELEDEFELEAEDELEFEDGAFLGALGGIARTVGGLLGGDAEFEDELEDEFEFEFEAEAETEFEAEGEDEDEDEAFLNPVRRIYRDAELMAHLARQAAATDREEEAEAFIGALVPLAAQLIPRAATLLARNAPVLIRNATRIVRRLRRDNSTRRLVEALPVVLQRTAQSMADQTAAGRLVDPDAAARILAGVTGQVFSTPETCRRAVHAVDIFDRRYRQRARRAAAVRRRPASHAGGPAYSSVAGYGGEPAGNGARRSQPARRRRRAPAKAARRARRNR